MNKDFKLPTKAQFIENVVWSLGAGFLASVIGGNGFAALVSTFILLNVIDTVFNTYLPDRSE